MYFAVPYTDTQHSYTFITQRFVARMKSLVKKKNLAEVEKENVQRFFPFIKVLQTNIVL